MTVNELIKKLEHFRDNVDFGEENVIFENMSEEEFDINSLYVNHKNELVLTSLF